MTITHGHPARMSRRFGRSAAILAATLLVSIAGCKGATPIRDLLNNAAAQDGKTVRIAGKVENSAGAFGYAVYRVNDGTGEINVVAKTGGVEGTFRQAFTIGTDVVAVIEESKRSSR
jgi:RecJ-like exonuclease